MSTASYELVHHCGGGKIGRGHEGTKHHAVSGKDRLLEEVLEARISRKTLYLEIKWSEGVLIKIKKMDEFTILYLIVKILRKLSSILKKKRTSSENLCWQIHT